MIRELSSLSSKKAGTFGNIPTKVLNTSSEICNKVLSEIWNSEILAKQHLSRDIKLANIKLVFNKKHPALAENYRPVRTLPAVSEMFERIIQNQL